jgi:gluconolactonase
MKRNFGRAFLSCALIVSAASILQSCSTGASKKPDWAKINKKILKEYKVVGRTRTDIPDTKVFSNLKDGVVDSLVNLPTFKLADGVTAKAYWGKATLVSFITLEPDASIPEGRVQGERFMFVLNGEVQELINGDYVNLKAVPADSPDGTNARTSVREFVYLLDGARTAIKAGPGGAKIVEVHSPVPAEYLRLAGVEDIPEPIDLTGLPVKPTVQPNKVYNLDDLQFTELVPGSNSRIIGGHGAQISFLRMDPDAFFERHIHPEEQVMVALRGWIDEIILDKVVRMRKGNILYLPGNMVHGGQLGPYGCDAIDVFFPPRTDYESKRKDRMAGFNAIIPESSSVNIVIDGATTRPGLTFTEGPVWLNGKLYFSNMFFDQQWNGSPAKSTLVEMNPDGSYRNILQGLQTNGIIATSNNTLIVCDMFGHRVIEIDTKGRILNILASGYDGKPLDGPNDLVMDSKGGIYFTDPQFTSDAVKNQPGRNVYYITPERKVIRLLEPNEFAMPNGVALSPDGKTLYINNCYDNESWWNVDSDKDNFVWAYDVKEDGTISNGRKFAKLHLTGEVLDRLGRSSGADGMKVDATGNLYVCTYAGLQIFNPEGSFIGIINLPTFPVNCAFGGPEMKTLYITSYNQIYSIQTNAKGLEIPR